MRALPTSEREPPENRSGAVLPGTIASPIEAFPEGCPAPNAGGDLLDLRFRALIPDRDWACLSLAVRRRFGKRLAQGASAVYVGRVTAVRYSHVGWLLAQAARLLGGPLPLDANPGRASVVTVTEDPDGGGQIWTRLYARASGFPQVIHSAKRFAGPTGLEEHVGAGVGMSLTVAVEDGALIFRSRGFFLEGFGRRVYLPGWLTPGALAVTHADAGEDEGEPPGAFRFILDIRHPWLGTLIRQEAIFRDAEPASLDGSGGPATDGGTMAGPQYR